MNLPKPKSISDEGLKGYLNRTAIEHNNYGYDDFVKRVELSEPKTIIAKAFGVNKITVYKWLNIYDNESVLTLKNKQKGINHET